MIPVSRRQLDVSLARKLDAKTAQLKETSAGVQQAKARWKGAETIRHDLGIVLAKMAFGASRCMYCGDSQGMGIDHFKPVAADPYLTFVWTNHLLACAICNSNEKRDQYPCDEDGTVLLIDPTADDPHDHIILNFATGQYGAITRKGTKTIEVFGLSRPLLESGRQKAFIRCKSMLRDWRSLRQNGESGEAEDVFGSLTAEPFADVLYSMIRRQDEPGAAAVFGKDVIAALRDLPSWP